MPEKKMRGTCNGCRRRRPLNVVIRPENIEQSTRPYRTYLCDDCLHAMQPALKPAADA